MALIIANNTRSTLAASITSASTTIYVQGGTGTTFPTISGADYAYVTLVSAASGAYEVVKITAHAAASDTFTIERAKDGTTAIAFNIGDVVSMRFCRIVAQEWSTAGSATAVNVGNTPAGTIAATNVQAALNELDTEKAKAGANTDITSLGGLTEPTGFRNKIINGDFDIWQRGTAAVTTHGVYGPDRWVFGSIGNSFSATQGAFVSGDALYDPTAGNTAAQYYSAINVTSVAGAANYTIIVQKIEDVRVLAGKAVTVSFWAKAAAGTPTVGINLLQNFGGGGSADVSGAGQPIVLSTTWTKYTKTFTVGSLNGKTVGTSSHTVLNFWLDAGSNYTAVSGGITQVSKTVSVAQVQLEAGSVATPFEHRPIGTELALCQRYFRRQYFRVAARSETDTQAKVGLSFPDMRVAGISASAVGTWTIQYGAGGQQSPSMFFTVETPTTIQAVATVPSGLGASGNNCSLIFGTVDIDAEL